MISFANWFKKGGGDSRSNNPDLEANPYLNAKRSWNSYVDSIRATRNIWMVIGMASMMIALVGAGGVIYIGSQSKFVPFVVQVDKFGDTISMGPLERANNADPRLVRASVSGFIKYMRSVSADGNLEKDMIFKVYAMVNEGDPAFKQIGDFFSDKKTNPFKRAAEELVTVEISSVLEQTDNTWNVDWVEKTMTRDGTLMGTKTWRATVTVYVAPPGKEMKLEQMMNNPMGIFVHSFSWQVIG